MKVIIESEHFNRTLKRITHEIIERNDNLNDVILVGVEKKGTPIALN
jgi:pyrimidine operon attenuation protein/uracil phosphoribosyltransferase